jgi:DNA polymerase III psi subunit
MNPVSSPSLSEYQKAILQELGISHWQLLAKDPATQHIKGAATTMISVVAEDKIAELAVAVEGLQSQANPATIIHKNAVLLTFEQGPNEPQMMNDILQSLGLDSNQRQYISSNELTDMAGYAVVWAHSQSHSYDGRALTTVSWSELRISTNKKQLWSLLQPTYNQSVV